MKKQWVHSESQQKMVDINISTTEHVLKTATKRIIILQKQNCNFEVLG